MASDTSPDARRVREVDGGPDVCVWGIAPCDRARARLRWGRRRWCPVRAVLPSAVLAARPRSSFWTLHLGGWALFALAMMVGRTGEWDLPRTLVTEPAFAAFAAAVSAVLRAVYVRLGMGTDRPVRTVAVAFIASYVGGLVWTVIHHLYLRGLAPEVLSVVYGEPVGPLQRGAFLDGTVFQSVILLAWSAIYVGARSYAELRGEQERALRAEARAHQARLQALRYQLNPHFLFNALNGVSTLVTEGRAREATAMLARLSEFLRLTLENDGAPEVPLADEVDFVRRYLEVEKARFGDRLRTRFDVTGDVLSAAVPALVLQPLVENAVKHAVAPQEGGALVAVRARREGGDLVVEVRDDGPGLGDGGGVDRASTEGLGVGLTNVHDRIRELYGDAGRLDLDEAEGGGLVVRLRVPFRPLGHRPASPLPPVTPPVVRQPSALERP